MATLVVFEALIRLLANLPTPWIGFWERIDICAFLPSIVVLAHVQDKYHVRVMKPIAAS